jgi:hypothetical protein
VVAVDLGLDLATHSTGTGMTNTSVSARQYIPAAPSFPLVCLLSNTKWIISDVQILFFFIFRVVS